MTGIQRITRSGRLMLCCGVALALLAGCDAASTSTAESLAGPQAAAKGGGANGQERVAVCHRTSSEANPYNLIEVALPALRAHLAHGDGRPSDEVPDRPGYAFDEGCGVVVDTEQIPTCPCFDVSLIDTAYEFNSETAFWFDAQIHWPTGPPHEHPPDRIVRGSTLLNQVGVPVGDDEFEFMWEFRVGSDSSTGSYSCSHSIPLLNSRGSESNITVEEAEACRLVIEESGYAVCEPSRGHPVLRTDQMCGVPFTSSGE